MMGLNVVGIENVECIGDGIGVVGGTEKVGGAFESLDLSDGFEDNFEWDVIKEVIS
jgi:hypothetical protein